jgi:hypothetical protein
LSPDYRCHPQLLSEFAGDALLSAKSVIMLHPAQSLPTLELLTQNRR